MKLTTKIVPSLNLPAGKTDHIFWDSDLPGFGLRIREHGSRTWVFQYKLGTKNRRMSLGSANAITVERARKGYRDEDDKIVQGSSDLDWRRLWPLPRGAVRADGE